MDAILAQLHFNLPCDIAAIWLFDTNAQDDVPIKSQKMYLAAYHTTEEFPPDGLENITLIPDDWVKKALTQRKPTIRHPEDPIGPIGHKYQLSKAYSSIAAPLLTGGEILGMLTLIHHTPGRYGDETQKITSAFASYAAVAIENNRLFQSSQEQAWISTILLQVAQATQSLTNLNELVGTIVRLTPMIIGIKGCAFFLREPNSDLFSLFDMYGIEAAQVENNLDLPYPVMDAPLLQDLLLTQQPMMVQDPQEELNLPENIAKIMAGRTLILLPVVSRGELLGAFLLGNENQINWTKNNAPIFGEEQLKIVQGIIQQTAVAIENIRLIEDKQEEAYVSTVLLQTAQAIVSGGTLDDTLNSIINILPILVGIDASAIYLWDEKETVFQISHAIVNGNPIKKSVSDLEFPRGEFPMLDTVYQNNRPIVYPFMGNTLPLEDWDLALPDEGQVDPSPVLQSRYPLLYGFPLSVKDKVFGVLLAEDENFATNRERRFELLYGIAQQASLAIQNDILNKEMLDRQRLEREFQLAREIQQTFLPDQMPETPGWEMDVHWETARQVGGDFYDYFLLPDGRLAIVIADVSDKGLAASLYMTVTRTLLRATALESKSPARTLEKVNDLLLANSQNGLFVTTFYGILSLESGLLTYTMAGHNPPMIVQNEENQVVQLEKGGIALGALPEIHLEERQLILNHGDCLVLYTDGVTEAFNLDDQMYGEERLMKVLKASMGQTAHKALRAIEADLEHFRMNAPLSDDTTILAVCRSQLLTDDHRDFSTA
jgi:serine phosphatase RsbU (regulator of sigma subunit)